MVKHGRSGIAVILACVVLLASAPAAYPSYDSEAGRKYTIACQRLAELRKSSKKKRYRSYWMDCIRTFESVEKKYSKSPSAGDACFDRAGLYFELYQFNKYSRDLDNSIQVLGKCQSTHPAHAKAPQALYRSLELTLDFKKNATAANTIYTKLAGAYPSSEWTTKAKTRLGIPERNNKPEPELRKKPTPAAAAKKTTQTQAGTVKNLRHWSEGAYTRIVIDQSTPVKFRAQELKNPDRLVFDLLHAHIAPGLNKEPLSINDGLLKQVRINQNAPDTVRVVLDLASIKSYVAFPLRDPDRLVIDVNGEGAGAGNVTTSAETGSPIKSGTPNGVEAVQKKIIPAPVAPQPQFEANNDGDRLTLSRQLGLKVKTIAIDAGHGGHDPGAIGQSGLKEKHITLDVAKRLAVLVKERLGCTVVMTRDRDVFIPLDQRPFIAKSHKADLFISIHVNANRKKKTKGIETYVQGLKASDREAMATAARENAMSPRTISELDDEVTKMLKDLKIDNKIEESIQLAGTVQASMVSTVKPVQKTVVNHGVKSAFFYVLMNTNMPSILAEIGFISNPEEEKLLKKDSYKQAIAEALYQGVKKYVDARSPQMMGI
jgi:N-acetylmuramoyl-L-alanine amidase